MTKTFKITVTIPNGIDDISEMQITMQSHSDLDAMRSINVAMRQLGIKSYDMHLEPLTYHVSPDKQVSNQDTYKTEISKADDNPDGFTHVVTDGYAEYNCYSQEHANEVKQALETFEDVMNMINTKYTPKAVETLDERLGYSPLIT